MRVLQASLWNESQNELAENATEGRRDTKTSSSGKTDVESCEERMVALYTRYGTSENLKQAWQNILHEFASVMPAASYQLVAGSALLDVNRGRGHHCHQCAQ